SPAGPPAPARRLPADDGLQPGRPAARDGLRGHRPRGMAVPLRTRPHRPRGSHRDHGRGVAPLSPPIVAVAGGRHGGERRGSGGPRAGLAAEGMVCLGPARRADLRQRRDRGGRRMADRGDRARPGHATDAGTRGRPDGGLRAALVDQPPAPRQGPRRADARIMAGDRQAVGLGGSQVMSATVDVWGWRARFRLARGQTIRDVIAKIPAIESGLGTLRGAVRVHPTPDDLANRCELRVLDFDPHADAIGWPGPSVTSITEPIDFGPFEDAAPCRVLFLRRHGLAGGATGGGKSGWLNVLMGNLVACEDVVIWAIDLKKGMELGPWTPCIDRLATTPEEAEALLADAVAVLEARAALLAEQGQRVWEPTPDMPALVIIIDEYAELADDAPEAVKHADSIA